VDDLLAHSVELFGKCIDAIRLIDVSMVRASNRYRASTHPVWEQIKQDYTLDQFAQSEALLEKIKRKQYTFELEEFEKEFKAIIKRAYMFSLPISIDMMELFFEEMKHEVGQNRASH